VSRWSHLLCWDCWRRIASQHFATRAAEPELRPCCMCGTLTESGIYRRATPDTYPCGGIHSWDEDE
jgi:hypothetical protein